MGRVENTYPPQHGPPHRLSTHYPMGCPIWTSLLVLVLKMGMYTCKYTCIWIILCVPPCYHHFQVQSLLVLLSKLHFKVDQKCNSWAYFSARKWQLFSVVLLLAAVCFIPSFYFCTRVHGDHIVIYRFLHWGKPRLIGNRLENGRNNMAREVDGECKYVHTNTYVFFALKVVGWSRKGSPWSSL